jgi:hypothetical protein
VKLVLGLSFAAVLLVGCSGGGSDLLAQMASTDGSIGTGEQRILIAVVDPATNELVGEPGVTVGATLRDGIRSPSVSTRASS